MNNILAEHLRDANLKIELSLDTLIELFDYVEANRTEKPKSIEPLLTQEEVINILKVDETTLWRWRKRGYITAIKMGGKIRYRETEIEAFINREGGEVA